MGLSGASEIVNNDSEALQKMRQNLQKGIDTETRDRNKIVGIKESEPLPGKKVLNGFVES